MEKGFLISSVFSNTRFYELGCSTPHALKKHINIAHERASKEIVTDPERHMQTLSVNCVILSDARLATYIPVTRDPNSSAKNPQGKTNMIQKTKISPSFFWSSTGPVLVLESAPRTTPPSQVTPMMVVPNEWGALRSRSIAARKKSFWIEIEPRREGNMRRMKPLSQVKRRVQNHVLITCVRSAGRPAPLMPSRPASPISRMRVWKTGSTRTQSHSLRLILR